MSKIRIGYIGTGSMGSSHVKIFRDHCGDDAQGVALFDPHPPSAEKAKEIIPDAKVFGDADALFASDIDAVCISTPNHTHLDYVTRALDAGKQVFCEKPVAITMEDCRRMIEASQRAKRFVFIGHEFRYSDYFKKIAELVHGGAIGTAQTIWCTECRGPFNEKVNRWIIDGRYSGGAMVDKNGHHFDLMNWWMQSRPTRVVAFGSRKFNHVLNTPDEVIDNATVSYEYENGAVGTLVLSMFAPDRGEDCLKFGIIGDKGLLETQLGDHTITIWPREKGADPIVHTIQADIAGFGSHVGFIEEHTAFIKACRTGKTPPTDVSICADATALSIAAEQSIKESRIIDIKY
jgi:predicted dehydrogenase